MSKLSGLHPILSQSTKEAFWASPSGRTEVVHLITNACICYTLGIVSITTTSTSLVPRYARITTRALNDQASYTRSPWCHRSPQIPLFLTNGLQTRKHTFISKICQELLAILIANLVDLIEFAEV